ncbi:MAG TPA: hypothetical protein VE404_03430, partial [Verrucomicrobiae bacterium]|nr:hypothetical protein [Verrucomicrobiae bacterium]
VIRDALRHGHLASIGSALLFAALAFLPLALVAKTTWRYFSTGRRVRRSRQSPVRRHSPGDA